MGEVVQLRHHVDERAPINRDSREDALVPVEFAVGMADRGAAIARLSYFGVRNFKHQSLKSNPAISLCMVSVADAISVNKKMLEHEDLSLDDIRVRIDLIQMLENIDVPMMQGLWKSIVFDESQTSSKV